MKNDRTQDFELVRSRLLLAAQVGVHEEVPALMRHRPNRTVEISQLAAEIVKRVQSLEPEIKPGQRSGQLGHKGTSRRRRPPSRTTA